MTSLCTCAPSFRLILRMATEHIPTLLPSPKCHNTHVCVCGRRGRITELCLPSSSLTASEVHSPGFILQGKRFLRILSAVFPPASLKWFCHPLQMPIGMMHTSGTLRPEAKQRKLDKPQALSQLVYEDVVEGFLARISDSSSLQGDSTVSLLCSIPGKMLWSCKQKAPADEILAFLSWLQGFPGKFCSPKPEHLVLAGVPVMTPCRREICSCRAFC